VRRVFGNFPLSLISKVRICVVMATLLKKRESKRTKDKGSDLQESTSATVNYYRKWKSSIVLQAFFLDSARDSENEQRV